MSGWLLENARQSRNPLGNGASPVGNAVFITISREKRSRHFHRQRQAEEAAPVLHHQRDVVQIERADKGEQAVAVEIERVDALVRRLVRASETEKVRRHHAAARREEMRDHPPIEIAPGRLAVQAQETPAPSSVPRRDRTSSNRKSPAGRCGYGRAKENRASWQSALRESAKGRSFRSNRRIADSITSSR